MAPAATRRATEELPRPWTAGAFVDVSYGWNSNLPASHVYRGMSASPRTGELSIPAAGVYLLREPGRVPVRLELAAHAGAGVDAIYAGEPDPGAQDEPTAGAEVWKHLARANVGGRIDRSGTEVGAGLFASPLGIGGFWTKDNWNYTLSWESNAAPFYLAGGRVRQDVKVGTLEAWVVNGWQTVADANDAPSVLLGGNLGKRGFTVAPWIYFGPERADTSPEAFRVLADLALTYDSPAWGFAAVWDVGQERRTDLAGAPRDLWAAMALFARVRLVQRGPAELDLAVRPEAFWDPDGAMFGARGWLYAGTVTATLDLFRALQLRLEYRYDRATTPGGFFFRGIRTTPGAPELAGDQHTIFLAAVAHFEGRFGTVSGASWPR